jgi:hypothetical protein
MTASPFAFTDPLAPPPTQAPKIGTLVPLGHAVIKVDVKASTTMTDTPNGYSADLQVMADQGDLDTEALAGDQGPAGQIRFQVAQIIDPTVSDPTQLKPLTDTTQDIGRYYIIQEHDNQGMITAQYAYVWYGSSYRKLMMGSFGPPGPVPAITPQVEAIPPDESSYVETFGPRLAPDWLFHVASPAGPSGPTQPVYLYPDVDENPATTVSGDLLTCTGSYTQSGSSIFSPKGLGAQLPLTYSMPESAFTAYSGVSQQAAIGAFAIPPQPFDWTPIVWGHVGEAGINLSKAPFKVGCQVLLGDPATGIQIARGIGNSLAVVNIYPHYSTGADKNRVISPNNGYAIVPKNHTNPAAGTVYVNLWNDGYYGAYDFQPGGAQLFIQVMPMERPVTQTTAPHRR